MDELLLNSDSDSDFDPRAEEVLDGKNESSNDLFGFEPPKSYGHQLFYNNNDNKQQNNNTNMSNELNLAPLRKLTTFYKIKMCF